MHGVQVQSLVRELRSHMPGSQKKKNTPKIKQKQYCKKLSTGFKNGPLQKRSLKKKKDPLYHQIFPGGSDDKESACNVRDLGSIPGSGIPWRREWQPTPVFLPGERIPWTEEPGGLQSTGSQRVRHN